MAIPDELEQAIAQNLLIVYAESSLKDSSSLMHQGDYSCVLVVEASELVGILTRTDLVRLMATGQDYTKISVAEVMTQPVITLDLDRFQDLAAPLNLLHQHHIHHLPLLNDRQYPIGLLTLESLLRADALRSQQQTQVAQIAREWLLTSIANRIQASLDLQTILDTTVTEIRQFLHTDRVIAYRFEPDWSGIVVAESVARGCDSLLGRILTDTHFGEAMVEPYKNGRIQVTDNINFVLTECHRDFLVQIQVKAIIVVPILQGDRLWGLLAAQECAQPRHWEASAVDLLQQLAAHIGIALQQATVLTQMQTELAQRQKVEAALSRSEVQYRFMFENNPNPMWIYETDTLAFLAVNRAAIAHYGYSEADFLAMTIRDIRPVEDVPKLEGILSNLQSPSYSGEWQHRKQDGTIVDVEITSHLINWEGKPARFSLVKDVSDRKRAEAALLQLNRELETRVERRTEALAASETHLNLIVDLVSDGILILNRYGQVVFANPSAGRMFGMQPEQLNGFDLGVPITLNKPFEIFILGKNGKIDVGEVVVSEMDWDNQFSYLTSIRDITERKQAEEQLVLANAELARATRLKDEFLANMSHELRTPLNAILGMSEGLQDEVFGALNEKQKKSIATIERSGQHLLELINDILDLAKIEAGKLELEIANTFVKTLCDTSLTFVRQMALKKGIQLITQIPDNLNAIEVDELRMRQVLINLLTNAVKFTPEGGRVTLEVKVESFESNAISTSLSQIAFSIADSGIGIAPEDIQKLFQSFVQIDSKLSRKYNGTGLGLSLVKRIAEMHGGSVTVESEINQGSCFTVRIPYHNSEPIPVDYSSGIDNLLPIHSNPVLIIEGSPMDTPQITHYLHELGLQGTVYPWSEGVVQEVIRVNPPLIVFDSCLPNLLGWEVLTQLKSHPLTQHIPILIISLVDERSQGLSLGAAEYIVKPIAKEQFRRAIHKTWNSKPDITTPNVEASPEMLQPLILIAEDDEANVDTIWDYLSNCGYRLIIAKNGQEAVYLAEIEKPDIVLMDIQMPIMDGLEATRQIRANPAMEHIPIVALTALAMAGDRERCLEVGVNDYLTKPVRLKQLNQTIQQQLQLAKARLV
ncbi:response regulator [Tumidithrix elongata RA019]|uniref:Circadian input-output histidine kinase CikA n=1 Tax=Tumidithrix elongata BACA0141 TaxID=2716417 RepID=A0AAW9Q121_9CYAN|nr:response regulator [Tumidithrix elongata RA019]